MSEKRCAVCNKILEPNEIRVIERNRGSSKRKSRYLCRKCRQREYTEYISSIEKIIKKNL